MKHTYLSQMVIDEALKGHCITKSEADKLKKKKRLIVNQRYLSLFIKKISL
jgi:hypothetical protein